MNESKTSLSDPSLGDASSSHPHGPPGGRSLPVDELLATDPTATPEQLSARFGRKNAQRTEQIEGILETLKGLGQL
jgi:hypothetical protein